MEKELKQISKFISLVLRHSPKTIGLQLDEQGWANVNELIGKLAVKGMLIDRTILETIVATNDKKRFSFNEDKTKIRANQGHSIEVELNLKPIEPPTILYHGTAEKYLSSILLSGIEKQTRQHVHLSATLDTAKKVGSRHGKTVVLIINALKMYQNGYEFYLSENQVWLTNAVPIIYISQ